MSQFIGRTIELNIENYVSLFLKKITINEKGCWIWTGATRRKGYGCLGIFGKLTASHRFIFEYFYNEINPKLTIDHLCRNTQCVNPKHLQEVSRKENIKRGKGMSVINSKKNTCNRGHPFYFYNNLRLEKDGERKCKICSRINARLYAQRKRSHE